MVLQRQDRVEVLLALGVKQELGSLVFGPELFGRRLRRRFAAQRVVRVSHELDEVGLGPAAVVGLPLLVEVLEVLERGEAGDLESCNRKQPVLLFGRKEKMRKKIRPRTKIFTFLTFLTSSDVGETNCDPNHRVYIPIQT